MRELTEIEVKKRLAFDNPWWDEGAISAKLRAWPKRAYVSGFVSLVAATNVNRAILLLGPRRVGKTVIIHQTIQRLIESGIKPQQILYVSVDTPVYFGWRLDQLVSLFQEVQGHAQTDSVFVFFDEIQYHKEWEVHLKSLVNSFPTIRFVASGSAAAALRTKSRESGAGRFTEFMLPPLSFAEFLAFRGLEEQLIDQGGQARDIAKLNDAFLDYLNFGGFPEAVMEDQVREQMDRYVGNDIIDKVLLRDLPSVYGISDTQELNRLFMTLAYNSGNEVTVEDLSRKSGVAKNTIKRYLEYLEAAFLIHPLHRIDQHARHFKRVTHFKVYLTNPCIRAALFGALRSDDAAMGAMAETAIIGQLVHSGAIGMFFYARWGAGEVDFVQLDSKTLRPVWICECKWSDRVIANPRKELASLVQFARENQPRIVQVLSRSVRRRISVDDISILISDASSYCYRFAKKILGALDEGIHPFSFEPLHAAIETTIAPE